MSTYLKTKARTLYSIERCPNVESRFLVLTSAVDNNRCYSCMQICICTLTVRTSHRRINTEEKAKVVAAFSGTALFIAELAPG